MTPDERQLLSGLFDRVRTASAQPRDREAETFIGDAVRTQPYAPYLLAQTVIVQDQALRAANERLQQLEAKVQALESGQGTGSDSGGGGFLGGLGRSIFGQSDQAPRASVPSAGPAQPGPAGYGQQGGYGPQGGSAPQGGYAQQGGYAPQGGPWAQGGGAPVQGGGFLRGALGAAAGVAGGVLLANSISGLFHGNSLGIGAGMPGLGGSPGEETVINNYYGSDAPSGSEPAGGGDGFSDASFESADGFGADDSGFGSDDGYNV